MFVQMHFLWARKNCVTHQNKNSTKLHPSMQVQGVYMGLSLCSVPLKTISPQFIQVLYL